jgi:uncharacterized protein YdhG (YjbR/CyaY superfamily)
VWRVHIGCEQFLQQGTKCCCLAHRRIAKRHPNINPRVDKGEVLEGVLGQGKAGFQCLAWGPVRFKWDAYVGAWRRHSPFHVGCN